MSALRIEHDARSMRVFRAGHDAPCLVQNAAPDQRPFIHPLMAPDGVGVMTMNAPAHHPWQHGLYTGLNDVNGVGFWTEGVRGNPKDGTFHPAPLPPPEAGADRVAWRVETDWRAPNGDDMLHETQSWRFIDRGREYVLDLAWTLRARIDLTFGLFGYGGLSLSMPFAPERGGQAINSDGLVDRQAEGQRARWVGVSMPLDGRQDPAGAAIMDHPGNPEHPTPWRVDEYLHINACRCRAASWSLARGRECAFRFRVFVHCGQTDPARVDEEWRQFATAAPAADARQQARS